MLNKLRCTFAAFLLAWMGSGGVGAETFNPLDPKDLLNTLERARAGDTIILGPGAYPIYRFNSRHGGTRDHPITLRADPPHLAVINATGAEAFVIGDPFWRFEDLTIEGNARAHHAFHLAGNADHVVIRNNRITGFHSHIKSNGLKNQFPDHVLIEGNRLQNTALRETDQPTTPIDVVGGDAWIIRDNVVVDFGRTGRESVSYGIFLKGNSTNGLIEQNLVICSQHHSGGYRIGISLGGGGTGEEFCEDNTCKYEHQYGVVRNNIVINCSDAGIYLKRAGISRILHNTLLLTDGIDLREKTTSAIVRNNYIGGVIQVHDGATLEESNNITSAWGWLPRSQEVANYISNRISDYHIKYPSLFSESFVETLGRLVEKVADWIADSRIGLGRTRTLRDFPNLAFGDLTPSDPGRLNHGAAIIDTVKRDFWNNEKEPGRSYVGAIDYGVSGCRLHGKFSDEGETQNKPCI